MKNPELITDGKGQCSVFLMTPAGVARKRPASG